MKNFTAKAAVCGSLIGLALALPAQAQTYNGPTARTYIVIPEPEAVLRAEVAVTPESATSRDAEGRPTRGAPGTGDADREVAMSRDGSYATSPRHVHRY